MWSLLIANDVDGDGDMDFLLGNCGYNDQFSKTSKDQPLQLYINDFDDNGTIDPIMCYYIQGKSYPMASRDELLDQVAPLKRSTSITKIMQMQPSMISFQKKKSARQKFFICDELASGILYNDGHNKFSFQPFPLMAQESKIFGITVDDFDKDGRKDILCSGNYFPYRVQLGRSDASLGLLMKGSANGNLMAIDPSVSGVYIDGDVRAMIEIKNKSGENLIIVAKNNDALQVLKADMK
jgi:hypothetical protein